MKKLIVILCAVVAVFGMTSCKSSSPSDTVKAYFKALQAGDYEKALSYTDITDQEAIQKQIEKYKGFDIKVVDFEILSEKISDDGNSATVEVKSTVTSSFNEEPEESTKEMKLMKVDGKWKLHA
jgi:hypothetical protein